MGYLVGGCCAHAGAVEGDEAVSKDQPFSWHVLDCKEKLLGEELE